MYMPVLFIHLSIVETPNGLLPPFGYCVLGYLYLIYVPSKHVQSLLFLFLRPRNEIGGSYGNFVFNF